MSCCLVNEFNRTQESEGRSTAGAYAIRQWLKQHQPKVALHPHKVDYCDFCKRMETELSRLRQLIKCFRQSGSSSAEDIQSNKQAVAEIEQELRGHKSRATEAQAFYRETTTKCLELWKDLEALMAKTSLSSEEVEELASKKHTFTLILSADYQQSKLIPYWGVRHNQAPLTTFKRCHMHMMYSVLWIIGMPSNTSPCLMKGLDQKIQITLSLSSKAILTRSLRFTRGFDGFFCSSTMLPIPIKTVICLAGEWNWSIEGH